MNFHIQIAIVLLVVSCLKVHETAGESAMWRDVKGRICKEILPLANLKITAERDVELTSDGKSLKICANDLRSGTSSYHYSSHSYSYSHSYQSSSFMIQATTLVLIPSIALLI